VVPRPFQGEVDLYEPVKRFLEGLGYEVKGEVHGCGVVAVRQGGDQGETEPPIVVELKLAFTLRQEHERLTGIVPAAEHRAYLTSV
jgi:hypothetical protein